MSTTKYFVNLVTQLQAIRAPGRYLPDEIMRRVLAHLPQITSAEMRTGVELAIDTDRRPEEICDLRYD